MNTPLFVTFAAAAAFISSSALAQLPTASPGAPSIPADSPIGGSKQSIGATTQPVAAPATGSQPSEEEMMRLMMENMKLNENHKLLAELVGDWTYTVKMWMDPSAPPLESKGTMTRRSEMDGRYFVGDASGKFPMPGPDGKMQDFNFKGRSTEAYDNAKKKFVSSWIDNMGTGIMLSEGTYDPSTKTFTYHANYDMAPGVQTKIRETIKVTDKDHHLMEWFEDRGGKEVKTMEIAYTRKK
jgi:hypothetical protein